MPFQYEAFHNEAEAESVSLPQRFAYTIHNNHFFIHFSKQPGPILEWILMHNSTIKPVSLLISI